MKNKIELKKSLAVSFLTIIIWTVVLVLFNHYEYRTYTKNFNNKLNDIITQIKEDYPNVLEKDIIKIINAPNTHNKNILSEYGIDLEKDSVIIENQKNHFCVGNIIILILLYISLLYIFFKHNKKQDNKLKEITNYIEEINKKNYKLDIDDNTEDELSILKNELYKITVMLKEQAENSLKDKINLKDSLSDISHQLKTPITSIMILLDNIIDNPNMDELTKIEFIKDIKKKILNINFLVQSILKLSKFDANTINFDNKNIKVIDIIKQSIINVSTLSDLKDVIIKVNGKNDIYINCDYKWQVEALTNILKNSIEYSNNGEVIEINFDNNKFYTTIKIKDNGKGIDEEDIKHIFERFYKGKKSSKESIGIGLALSKAIIEKNKGSISVESKKQKGTTFIIKYFNEMK